MRVRGSNIYYKIFALNVRSYFDALTHLYRTYYFSCKRCKIDFHLLLSIFHSGSRMSHHALSLLEPLAQNSIIGGNSVEHSAHLPFLNLILLVNALPSEQGWTSNLRSCPQTWAL